MFPSRISNKSKKFKIYIREKYINQKNSKLLEPAKYDEF